MRLAQGREGSGKVWHEHSIHRGKASNSDFVTEIVFIVGSLVVVGSLLFTMFWALVP